MKSTSIYAEVRRKLDLTQEELALILDVSRAYLSHEEAGRRILPAGKSKLLSDMYLQFHELEKDTQPAQRSTETELFLQQEFKKILPKMKFMEENCRFKIRQLSRELEKMKIRARELEHAIIVYTTMISSLIAANKSPDQPDLQVKGLQLYKDKAYRSLLRCWGPAQAKLHSKIEAITGEAKALRKYRIELMKEHEAGSFE